MKISLSPVFVGNLHWSDINNFRKIIVVSVSLLTLDLAVPVVVVLFVMGLFFPKKNQLSFIIYIIYLNENNFEFAIHCFNYCTVFFAYSSTGTKNYLFVGRLIALK